MPEIPDMEVYRRSLEKLLIGREVTGVRVHVPKRVYASSDELSSALIGAKLSEVKRQGKELYFGFSSGHTISTHLMLAGMFELAADAETVKYKRFSLQFDNGQSLVVQDMSGWAAIKLNPKAPSAPDALDPAFTLEYFKEKLKRKSSQNIKLVLVDQNVVQGIGNKYSDEILWAAKISPESVVGKLPEDAVAALYYAIKDVLNEAVRTLCEHYCDKINGKMREFLKIHDRTVSPTGKPVTIKDVAGKKTYFSEEEQKLYA